MPWSLSGGVASSCVHNGHIYIVGGKTEVWRTKDGSNWTMMTDSLPPKMLHKVASLNGYI